MSFELFGLKDQCTRYHDEPDLGAASNVVVRLCRNVPIVVNHKPYYDNYFASIPLILYLVNKKIQCVSTVGEL